LFITLPIVVARRKKMLPITKHRLIVLIDNAHLYAQDIENLLSILKREIAALLIEEHVLLNNRDSLRNSYNFNNRKIRGLEAMIAAIVRNGHSDDTSPFISRLKELKANSPIIEKQIDDEDRKIVAVRNERDLFIEKEKNLKEKLVHI
jgi:hypothetical protein